MENCLLFMVKKIHIVIIPEKTTTANTVRTLIIRHQICAEMHSNAVIDPEEIRVNLGLRLVENLSLPIPSLEGGEKGEVLTLQKYYGQASRNHTPWAYDEYLILR
jgi:hypothetical protein